MKRISSRANPLLKEAVSLLRRKYRDRLKLYLIEGEKMVREALDAGLVVRLFVPESKKPDHEKLLLFARLACHVETVILSDECFSLLEATVMSQGLVAVARQEDRDEGEWESLLASGPINILVIDQVQDPGNIGSLIRTAAASGFKAVIMTKGTADPYSPKITRAATGLNRIPFIKMVEGPGEAIDWLKSHNKRIVVADSGGQTAYYESTLVEDTALVLGNEGSGVGQEFLDAADELVFIPMDSGVESLNVAVAGGILMYNILERKARCKNKMQK